MGEIVGNTWVSDYSGAEIDERLSRATPWGTTSRNLLDNSYFIGGGTGYGVFPVNQRGNTQYSGGSSAQHAFDRWNVSNATATLTANGVNLVSTGSYGLFQYLSAGRWDLLVGKTVTLSALVTANSGDLKFYSGSTLQATRTGTGVLSATFVVPGDFTASSKFVGIQGNATISSVKLELGSRQTLARKVGNTWVLNDPPPDYGEELAKCQRYLTVYHGRAYIGYGYVNNSTFVIATVTTPVPMEAISSTASSGIYAYVIGTGWVATTGVPTIIDRSANLVTFYVSLDSAASDGSPAFLKFGDTTADSNYLMFSAE